MFGIKLWEKMLNARFTLSKCKQAIPLAEAQTKINQTKWKSNISVLLCLCLGDGRRSHATTTSNGKSLISLTFCSFFSFLEMQQITKIQLFSFFFPNQGMMGGAMQQQPQMVIFWIIQQYWLVFLETYKITSEFVCFYPGGGRWSHAAAATNGNVFIS